MQLAKDVDQFSKSCERLICEAAMSAGRKLTEDEASLIEFYCLEVLEKVLHRPMAPHSGTS